MPLSNWQSTGRGNKRFSKLTSCASAKRSSKGEQRAALVVRRLPVDRRGHERTNGAGQWEPGDQENS